MSGKETYRQALEARRVQEYGGGACTLLVRRIDGDVEVLFHAVPETGAVLTHQQATELAYALLAATE